MRAAVDLFHERRLTRRAVVVLVAMSWAVGWGLVGCGEETKPAASGSAEEKSARALHNPFAHRIKAPGLNGGTAWLNTSGPLELEKLRGKFVLLDFWTYCCINCMHILPELKELEKTFPNELVVIGVHSAKFDAEQDSKNITDAILRYEIRHPVVNDSKHRIWNAYGVNTWPTVWLIDPEGYAVLMTTGEFKADAIARKIRAAIPWYRKKGELDETPLRFDLAAYSAADTPLRYPGKIMADEAGGRLFIADSNHNRIVIASMDGTLLDTIGSGRIGKADGDYQSASFNHPQGMALNGDTLYVADTENHMLRKVNLAKRQVITVAGTGQQGSRPRAHWSGKPKTTELNSPWDLCVHGKVLYIAMAGPHQIWRMPLTESDIGPYAGNGREDIVDGSLLPPAPYEEGFSSFAQPSGLATDGTWLYVADSEGSSIRAVPFVPSGKVKTVIGTSHLNQGRLFAFGDVDGEGFTPRLQHCLGIVYYKGNLYVADTYNNKIKVVAPERASSRTLVGDGKPGDSDDPAEFDEPAGLTAAAGKLYVADTNNHRIRTIDLDNRDRVSTLEIKGLKPPRVDDESEADARPAAKAVELPLVRVQPSNRALRVEVRLDLPDGWKINTLGPARYTVRPLESQGVLDRAQLGKPVKLDSPAEDFDILLPLAADRGDDRFQLTVNYYYCQIAGGLCKAGTAAWDIPVAVAPDAQKSTILLEHHAR